MRKKLAWLRHRSQYMSLCKSSQEEYQRMFWSCSQWLDKGEQNGLECLKGQLWAPWDREVDCHNWLSLPGRERDLAAPAGTWTRAESSARLGMCLLLFVSLGNCRFAYHTICGGDLVPFDCWARHDCCRQGLRLKERFPARCLFPFSLCASVKNLLGHLGANKTEFPYFNLHTRSWASGPLCLLLLCHSISGPLYW